MGTGKELMIAPASSIIVHEHEDREEEKVAEKNERLIIIEKGDRAAALKFLQERAAEPVAEPQKSCVCCMDDDIKRDGFDYAHQNPGSFIHNFAVGQMTLKQVVEAAKQFDVFTSHASCGAAKLVHAELQKPEVRAQFAHEDVLGDRVAELMAGEPDELGKAFSEFIARKAGVEYQHLQVDRKVVDGKAMHSAAIAILDKAGLFHGTSVDRKGAYIVHSLTDVSGATEADAVTEWAIYGPLAEAIAHSHSHVPHDGMFTILIVTDEDNKAMAERSRQKIEEVIALSGKSELLQVMLFDKGEVLQTR